MVVKGQLSYDQCEYKHSVTDAEELDTMIKQYLVMKTRFFEEAFVYLLLCMGLCTMFAVFLAFKQSPQTYMDWIAAIISGVGTWTVAITVFHAARDLQKA